MAKAERYDRGDGSAAGKHRPWRTNAMICGVWALCLASPVAAQPTQKLLQEAVCTGCRVEVRRIATLGSETDTAIAIGHASIIRNSAGQFFVANVGGNSNSIRVYDPAGKYLRSIGRKGQGPGEFRSITHLSLGRGDTIFAFDMTRRVSVLSPTGEYVRGFTVHPVPTDAVLLENGDVVVASAYNTPAYAGFPVHQVSRNGTHVRSFGADPPVLDPDRPSLSMRWVSGARDQGFWTARPDRYLLEHWAADGRRTQTLTRKVAWFPERETEMNPNLAPTPFIRGVKVGPDGHVFVLAVGPEDNWQRHRIVRHEMNPFIPEEEDKLFDSFIEVIDPQTATVIAKTRLPFYAWGFASLNTIWSMREGASGVFLIEVWEVRLVTQ